MAEGLEHSTDALLLKIELSLTAHTYSISGAARDINTAPRLCVRSKLISPATACVDITGEFDSGNVLDGNVFRAEWFSFFDVTSNKSVVNIDPFPGTCNAYISLNRQDVVELSSCQIHETGITLHDGPLSDPVRQLEAGHEYRIQLIPQKARTYACSLEQLFGNREWIPMTHWLPLAKEIILESDDVLMLKVVD